MSKIIQVIPVKETLYSVCEVMDDSGVKDGTYSAYPVHYLGLRDNGELHPIGLADGYFDEQPETACNYVGVYHYCQLKEFHDIEIIEETQSHQIAKELEQIGINVRLLEIAINAAVERMGY